jgi:hypothetical protein
VGSNRAEASLERLQELNPMVSADLFFSPAFHFYGKLPVGFRKKRKGGAGWEVFLFFLIFVCSRILYE